MPAYFYDPYMYRAHKIKGGTFQNYKDKTYLRLTDKEITKHLNGEQLIGIYPLLTDNSSWFLVADFDKENWIAEAKSFIKSCQAKGFPAYFERRPGARNLFIRSWAPLTVKLPANFDFSRDNWSVFFPDKMFFS